MEYYSVNIDWVQDLTKECSEYCHTVHCDECKIKKECSEIFDMTNKGYLSRSTYGWNKPINLTNTRNFGNIIFYTIDRETFIMNNCKRCSLDCRDNSICQDGMIFDESIKQIHSLLQTAYNKINKT